MLHYPDSAIDESEVIYDLISTDETHRWRQKKMCIFLYKQVDGVVIFNEDQLLITYFEDEIIDARCFENWINVW